MNPTLAGVCVRLLKGINPRTDAVNRRFLQQRAEVMVELEHRKTPHPPGADPQRWGSMEVSRTDTEERYRHLAAEGTCVAGISLDHASGAGDYYLMGNECVFGPPLDRFLFARLLGQRGLAIAHAAGVIFDGQGVLVGAPSGGGKTTFAGLAEASGVDVLSDERVVVGLDDAAAGIWGTPWYGDGGQAQPGPAPLVQILFLEQSDRNAFTPLSPAGAAARLLALCTLPHWNVDATRRAVAGVTAAVQCTPAAVLQFTRERSSVDYVRDHLPS